MRFLQEKIVTIFSIILVLIGISLFLLKDSIFTNLSGRIDLDKNALKIGKNEELSALNLDSFLSEASISALRNNILFFNFNKLGQADLNLELRPGLQAPVWPRVYLGNSNPFLQRID